jgi:hypothetical protein
MRPRLGRNGPDALVPFHLLLLRRQYMGQDPCTVYVLVSPSQSHLGYLAYRQIQTRGFTTTACGRHLPFGFAPLALLIKMVH